MDAQKCDFIVSPALSLSASYLTWIIHEISGTRSPGRVVRDAQSGTPIPGRPVQIHPSAYLVTALISSRWRAIPRTLGSSH